MISKILKLQNVGLLQDATESGAVALGQVTAIYADNGRGKSTLAAVLRACQLGDAGRLNARKTIDATSAPEVKFLLPTGSYVEFTTNAWSATLPDIVVFDSEFVEQNVYSGFEVRADQRQSLLEFALGNQTVQLKQQIDQLAQDIDTQTRKRTLAEKALTGFASPYTVTQFLPLQPVPDADAKIDALQRRIQAAKGIQQLATRKDPVELPQIQLDVSSIFTALRRQMQDVEQSAEQTVKAHIAKHHENAFEDWVSRGQQYLSDEECPFCGQSVGGLKLIDAYKSHFRKAYADLKQEMAALETLVTSELSEARLDALVSASALNSERIEMWADQLKLDSPELLEMHIASLREPLLTYIRAKQKEPLERWGSEEHELELSEFAASIKQTISEYNTKIRVVVGQIAQFKKTLSGENISILQSELSKLEAAKKRQSAHVVAAVKDHQEAETERKRLDGEKTKARQQLDALMQTTLQQYQISINNLLTTFGAEFSIEQLKPTYLGSGEPRSEYGLCVRNKSVKLGSRADIATGHSFATTLSEADKRTLAFAFFVARLKADPNLAGKLVVLDDPVSSLDRNRRYQSIRLIATLAGDCRQLLVLSHDAYFVREVRERLGERKPTPITPHILTIKRVSQGYSAFAQCDIDDVCSSDYYRHHRLVADYVDGKSTANTRDVAKAIRPLLEGYYHRRFPEKIPRRLMFGQIIALAAQAPGGDPLSYLQPMLKEMGEVNDYAGQFHHDPNPGFETVTVVDGELLGFAKRALKLIYQNG